MQFFMYNKFDIFDYTAQKFAQKLNIILLGNVKQTLHTQGHNQLLDGKQCAVWLAL